MISRTTGALAVAALLALTATACGDDPPSTSGGSASTSAVTVADAAFPVTVTHTFGETAIPARPQRVAALDAYEADVVLALGLEPVGINYYDGYDDGIAAWQQPLLADPPPERLRYVDGYDIESTAALKPDLILGSYVDDATYALLSDVAPTVVLDYESDLRDRVRTIGAAVGLPTEAEALIAEYDETVAAAKEDIGLTGKTVAAVGYYVSGTISNVSDADSFSVLADLGAVPAPSLAAIEPYADMGVERLDLLDADLVLISYGDDALQDELEANPLFAALPAVKEGRYLGIIADGEQDVTRARGVLQVPFVLERFGPAVKALDLP